LKTLLPRLLGVIGIHAVLGLLAWLIDGWLVVRQEGLSTDLLTRIDGDPARAEAYLADIGGDILTATAGSLLLSAVLACVWLTMIYRNPPYGDKSARSRRGSWSALLLVGMVGCLGLFWERLVGASVADLLAPGAPVKATIIGAFGVLVSYWVSTAVFVPVSTKVAVPGGSLFLR
jgi:hypothetical protein